MVDTSRPVIRPPDAGHEPHNPVRDHARQTAHEDVDREPDGVPHSVVGLTALFSVVLALLVAAMFISGHVAGQVGAVALAALAIPTLVTVLRSKAARERDRDHPSR